MFLHFWSLTFSLISFFKVYFQKDSLILFLKLRPAWFSSLPADWDARISQACCTKCALRIRSVLWRLKTLFPQWPDSPARFLSSYLVSGHCARAHFFFFPVLFGVVVFGLPDPNHSFTRPLTPTPVWYSPSSFF